MLVAIVVEPYAGLHEQVQEAAGPSKPFPNCSGRESSLARLPAIRAGGTEDGNRHRSIATRRVGTERSARRQNRGWNGHEHVPSEADLWRRYLLAWSTPAPGRSAPI